MLKILLSILIVGNFLFATEMPYQIKELSKEEIAHDLKQFKTHVKFQETKYNVVFVCSEIELLFPSGKTITKQEGIYFCDSISSLLDKKFLLEQNKIILIESPFVEFDRAYLVKWARNLLKIPCSLLFYSGFL